MTAVMAAGSGCGHATGANADGLAGDEPARTKEVSVCCDVD
jgi:hypothetical protein